MSRTVDCGEGKCHLCIGWGTTHFLFPQLNDGERFECSCQCHTRNAAPAPSVGDDAETAMTGIRAALDAHEREPAE